MLDKPHIFLDEIMRQEEDSEIIQLTSQIRNFKPVINQDGKDVKVMNKEELTTGMLLWADQILVGTNKTRVAINNQMRELLGKTSQTPQEGDKLICCRNYWDTLSDTDFDLINGTIGYLKNNYQTKHYFPNKVVDITMGQLETDLIGTYDDLQMDTKMIITGEKALTPQENYRFSSSKKYRPLVPLEFTYGYAITTHRAQGSEYDKVLVIEEPFPFDKKEHARWLYTACTRASSRLVLLR